MGQFIVTAPDGRKFEVTAPDGASQADVLAYAQRQVAGQKPVGMSNDLKKPQGMSEDLKTQQTRVARVRMPDGRVGRFEVPGDMTPDQLTAHVQQQQGPWTKYQNQQQPGPWKTRMQQLETALINADKAGDTAAARTLAAEIKRHRSERFVIEDTPPSNHGRFVIESDTPSTNGKGVDLKRLSTADLEALRDGDLTRVSTAGLEYLRGAVGGAQGAKPSAGKGGVAGGMFMGAIRDPLDAGAQVLTRAVSSVTSLGGKFPNAVSRWADSEAARVDAMARNANAEYQQSRKIAGRDGFDAARLGGNVVSPANMAIVARVPMLGTQGLLSMAGRGAAQGGLAGLLQPVVDDERDFATQKLVQVGAGTVGGGLLTPVAAKVTHGLLNAGHSGVNALSRFIKKDAPLSAAQMEQVNRYVTDALGKNGIDDLSKVPANMIATLRTQAEQALRAGQKLTPEAGLRKADFDMLGIRPTVGQLTRDPMQFARERNLRGIEGVGNDLTQRFSEQNSMLGNRLLDLVNGKIPEPGEAGNALTRILREADAPRAQAVSQAYQLARDSAGRYAGIDVPSFSQSANNALDTKMLGRFLPNEVRGLLNDISSGKIPLNVNNLVQVDSVMSAAQRAAKARGDDAAWTAISEVRNSLHNANISSSAGVQAKAAFDTARSLARNRFATIENTPAMQAALDGADPDVFVRKFVLNGSTRDLTALAQSIGDNQEGRQLVRSQIVSFLRDKAFGANVTGDKPFSQESYNRALKSMGTAKLSTFFSPAEIAQLEAVGRVAGYVNSQPSGAAVNNSNTAAAAMNLFSTLSAKVGPVGSWPGVNLLRDTVRTYANEKALQDALSGALPKQKPELPPEVVQGMLKLLPAYPIGFASAVGSPSE